MATVKCRECDKRDTDKAFMENLGTEKAPKWIHPQCVKAWKAKEAAKIDGNKEWFELCEVACQIHGFQVLTKPMVFVLRALGNGEYVSKKHGQQKKAIPYKIIEEAYKLSASDIEYFKATRKFNSDVNEFNYCIEIVVGNINNAYKRRKNKRVEEMKIEADANRHIEPERKTPVVYKQKKHKNDISEFLD